jgi:hypothetical protein
MPKIVVNRWTGNKCEDYDDFVVKESEVHVSCSCGNQLVMTNNDSMYCVCGAFYRSGLWWNR